MTEIAYEHPDEKRKQVVAIVSYLESIDATLKEIKDLLKNQNK
jgi:hypothetical protein